MIISYKEGFWKPCVGVLRRIPYIIKLPNDGLKLMKEKKNDVNYTNRLCEGNGWVTPILLLISIKLICKRFNRQVFRLMGRHFIGNRFINQYTKILVSKMKILCPNLKKILFLRFICGTSSQRRNTCYGHKRKIHRASGQGNTGLLWLRGTMNVLNRTLAKCFPTCFDRSLH